MKIMMFEDSFDNPIGSLYSFVYNNSDIKLIGCGGKDNIVSELESLYSSNRDIELCIIYLDMYPDNMDLIRAYNKLCKYIRRNKICNCFIIPIKSAEYRVALLFNKYKNMLSLNSFMKYFEKCNYENYVKMLFKNDTTCFTMNITNPLYGMFYSSDCICEDCKEDNTSLRRIDKSVMFVRSLPCFIARGKLFGEYKNVNMVDIHKREVDKYNMLVEEFKNCGIITEVCSTQRVLGYQQAFDVCGNRII